MKKEKRKRWRLGGRMRWDECAQCGLMGCWDGGFPRLCMAERSSSMSPDRWLTLTAIIGRMDGKWEGQSSRHSTGRTGEPLTSTWLRYCTQTLSQQLKCTPWWAYQKYICKHMQQTGRGPSPSPRRLKPTRTNTQTRHRHRGTAHGLKAWSGSSWINFPFPYLFLFLIHRNTNLTQSPQLSGSFLSSLTHFGSGAVSLNANPEQIPFPPPTLRFINTSEEIRVALLRPNKSILCT